ncbi:hypothetical protein ACFOWZ_02745 [Lentzea rhizosphaerae]|uniref:Uncharacterized protein n=1 Tax=Lentzea rhizosphaerae TaxID=2041025 RepID=A0ABV8BLX6_9PSEU
MEIVEGPGIVSKPEIHYVGIRVTTPFRGMLVVPEPHDGDDRVRPGVLPAGRYACLTYVSHARQAVTTSRAATKPSSRTRGSSG